jgi:hypothetical protein
VTSAKLDAGAQYMGFKNRIINGDMKIDQRNAGASVTPFDGQYTLDRWRAYQSAASKFSAQQNAGSVTPPAGFTKYLGITSLSSYSVLSSGYNIIRQNIEGLNVSDLGWGTANAQPVTLSFWVRSSLTGTFGGSLSNSSQARSYPFSYTISAANTWEQKTVTIPGDTSGTWLTDNGIGITVNFGLGVGTTYSGTAGAWAGSTFFSATGATSVVGTNGATFYITGVQLEKGSTATSFDYRPYGTELALCQRYYQRFTGTLYSSNANFGYAIWSFKSTMRVSPTLTGNGAGSLIDGNSADFAQCYLNGYARWENPTASAEL